MKINRALLASAIVATACAAAGAVVQAQAPAKAPPKPSPKTSFFLTSVGLGKGADLGGLAGADAHCADLAKKAGLVRQDWRAYLSITPTKDKDGKDVPGVNARDRIGKGPWRNAKGVVVANNVAQLHGPKSKINQDTALSERGEVISGRPQALAKSGPNRHDVLTGSDPQGLYIVTGDTTCGNWSKSSGEAPANSAIVGHHDRMGLNPFRHSTSWNSSHGTRGCSQDNLKASGGDGLFYCFSEK
jgi:hypothetical protein